MKVKFSILILFIMGIFSSCGTYYYVPTQQVVPTFEKKGDIQVTAGSAPNSGMTGGSVAGAITDEIAVQVNGVHGIKTSRNNYEAAIGYYKSLHKKINFNCFVGYGQAQVADRPLKYRMSFDRVFVQPSLAYTTKNFEAIFSLKASRLNYDVDVLGDYNTRVHDNLLSYDQSKYITIEPCYTIRYGYENLKLQVQFADSKELTNQIFEKYDGDLNIGLVFQYPLSKLYN